MLRCIFSLALIASLTTVSTAQPPGRDRDRQQPGRGNAAKGQADAENDQAGRRQVGQWPGAMNRRGGPMMQADPEMVAAKMMQQFDKDGDSKLNSVELVALVKSLRERMQGQADARPGMPRRDGMQRPGGRPGSGKSMRGRNGGDGQSATPGGDKPKRPGSDTDA